MNVVFWKLDPGRMKEKPMTQKPGILTDGPSIEDFLRSAPEEGSLALLALGAVGVIAWRKKLDAIRQEREGSGMKEQGATNG
jgi:hypothetical protein